MLLIQVGRRNLVWLCLLLSGAWLLSGCGTEPESSALESGGDEPRRARVLVVELHGFVGCGVDADLIRSPLAQALAEIGSEPDAVVFSIDSGGGMLNRVGPLSDLLHGTFGDGGDDGEPVCIGWVSRAESAAALVALNIPELWMPPDGVIGGAVGVRAGSGGWESLPQGEQEAIRYMAAACAARGGHDQDLALSLVAPGADSGGDGAGYAMVLTGGGAEEAGLVRVVMTLEDALDERFGESGWMVDAESSSEVNRAIAEAERIRERFVRLQQRFEIAAGMARDGGEKEMIEVADGYLDEALALSTKDDPATLRAMAFLGGYGWVSWAIDELEALSGEGGR